MRGNTRGMTADKLAELELAYAPPYSSAKDPVNMAGFMIENLETEKVAQFHWNEVEKLKCDGSMTLIDVRTAEEFDSGHIKGFFNIPVDELREHIEEFDIKKPVYVVCQSDLEVILRAVFCHSMVLNVIIFPADMVFTVR